jgi:hypothetical protein
MVGEKPASFMKSLQAKESLLQALIESEQVRLNVWLHPLGDPGYSSNQAKSFTEVSFQLFSQGDTHLILSGFTRKSC